MRKCMIVVMYIVAFFVIDGVLFDGHDGGLAWREARNQTQQLRYELNKLIPLS